MDVQMPELSGIEATRRTVNEQPQIGVLVLTMFDDDQSIFAAMRAGARGYLLKDADENDLLRALRAVADGEAIFGPVSPSGSSSSSPLARARQAATSPRARSRNSPIASARS